MKQKNSLYDIRNQNAEVICTISAVDERNALCKFIMQREDLNDIVLYKNLSGNRWRISEYDDDDIYFYACKRSDFIDFDNTKIVIETKNGNVYVNGEKHDYASCYKLTTRDKILISAASAIDYEPANCLILDDVDWDADINNEEDK